MRFYHLTTEDVAATIYEQCMLRASYGSNNLLCNEAEPYVFFCDEESVPYWSLLLRKSIAVPFDLRGHHTLNYYNYGLYSEFYINEDVRIRAMKPATVAADESVYRRLRERYTRTLSMLVTQGLCTDVSRQHWVRDVFGTVAVVERLNFGHAPREELTTVLRDLADDGEYTFLDTYNNTPIRCYQQLLKITDPLTCLARATLYDAIVRNFKGVLDLNTGGADIR